MPTLEAHPGKDPEQMLASVGSAFWSIDADDIPEGDVAEVLAEGERQVRVSVVVPPADEAGADEGMGAWHVNARDEMHLVRAGVGILQVVTPEGIVTVWLDPGTVMVMRGAEHRYRPLTEQAWTMRFSGPADADLGATATGRAAEPWPTRAS